MRSHHHRRTATRQGKQNGDEVWRMKQSRDTCLESGGLSYRLTQELFVTQGNHSRGKMAEKMRTGVQFKQTIDKLANCFILFFLEGTMALVRPIHHPPHTINNPHRELSYLEVRENKNED